jgi:hypothetical protein
MIGSLREVNSSLGKVTDTASTEQATAVVEREAAHLGELRKRLALLAPLRPSGKVKQRSEEVANESKAFRHTVAHLPERLRSGKVAVEQGKKLTLAVNIYGAGMMHFTSEAAPLSE